MFLRLLRRLGVNLQGLTFTDVIIGLVGGVLLDCSILSAIASVFHVRKFNLWLAYSWGVPLRWNWDTTWKVAVIALLLWIVNLLRRNIRRVAVVLLVDTIPPRSSLNGLTFGAFDTGPAFRQSMVNNLKNQSAYQMLRDSNVDFASHPELVRLIKKHDLMSHLTGSQRQAYDLQVNRLFGNN